MLDEFFAKEESVNIGSNTDNFIVLEGWKIAKRHAQLLLREDGVYIINLTKMKPVLVGGEKVDSYGPLTVDDVVQIANFKLKVKVTNIDPDATEERQMASQAEKQRAIYQQWQRRLHDLVAVELKTHGITLQSENSRTLIKNVVSGCLKSLHGIPEGVEVSKLAQRVYGEIVGYGPLDPLLNEDTVSEIMVNAYNEIFYQKDGQNYLFNGSFTDDAAVVEIVKRMVKDAGRNIDDSAPLVDASLSDGSRINAVIPPLAVRGASLTIRKFSREKLSAAHLINHGSIDSNILKFLQMAIVHRKNIVISGGTGTGKSTLLNVLTDFIPDSERVVTVEDVAELSLTQANRVALESRPPDAYGKGEIKIRDLVKNALRMSPDRIIVGECRGGEALDMLQAMNTGHAGSLTTLHANSSRDCIGRLEVLVLMSGVELPLSAIRNQIAKAVDVIIQVTRFPCGSRKVTSVSEVCGIEGEAVQLGEIFHFVPTGHDHRGKVIGRFEATGIIPTFYEQLRERGIETDMAVFQ